MTTSLIIKRLIAGTFYLSSSLPTQITDLLQLSRKESEMKTLCRSSLHRFGQWKINHKLCKGMESKIISSLEGIVLKRQVRDTILFYRLVRRRRIRSFELYISKLPVLMAGKGDAL